MKNLPEEQDAASFIKRPNNNAGPCVSGTTGRYEIPSSTPSASSMFASKRRTAQSEPRSDATIPYKMKG